jgi:hypothetical protein
LPARFLRQASQAADKLWKLAECEPPPPANERAMDDHAVFCRLAEIREAAEDAGRVPKSEQIYWTVETWLRALQGEEQPLSGPHPLNSPRGELARAIVSGGERKGVSTAGNLRTLAEACEKEERRKETGNRGQETGVCSSSSSSSSSPSSLPLDPATHGQVINLPDVEMHNRIPPEQCATPEAAASYGLPPRPKRKFLNPELCDHRHVPEPTEDENMERLKARKRRERAIRICPVAGP